MRPVRLARLAAQAEGVRLRRLLSRVVSRLILAIVAFLFVLGAVVFGHIAAWYEIRAGLNQTFLATTGIVGGADLFVAVILGLLAARSSPSRVELEALDVRRKAVQGLTSTLSLTQLLIPILRLMIIRRRGKRER